MKDLSKVTISCTGLGDLMTEPQAKADKDAGLLSASAKEYLNGVFIRAKYNRKREIENKYFEKGRQVEEAGIALYCHLTDSYAEKNEEFIFNDLIHGIPDLIFGETKKASLVVDIKAPYDLWSFYKSRTSKLNKDYWWQLQGYMALTNAPVARLAYTLIDITPKLLSDERRRLGWQLSANENETTEFLDAMAQLTFNFTYKDIPDNERIFCFDVPRDNVAIASIQAKVEKAREYLLELDSKAVFRVEQHHFG